LNAVFKPLKIVARSNAEASKRNRLYPMKRLWIAFFFLLAGPSSGTTKVSGNIVALRNFCVVVFQELRESPTPDLPTSWSEIGFVGTMKVEEWAGGARAMRLINSLAVTPSLPVLPDGQSKIPESFRGNRVFAISRSETSKGEEAVGRYVLLLGRDQEGRAETFYPVFARREVADVILASIGGLDLEAQPRAFTDAEIARFSKGKVEPVGRSKLLMWGAGIVTILLALLAMGMRKGRNAVGFG
jgi:hypothetical protein